jgi:hypothetical protein
MGHTLNSLPSDLGEGSALEYFLANQPWRLPWQTFLYHFDWVLPGGNSPELLDMTEKYGIIVGRKYDLQLIAISHGCFN